jgi:collagen type III alpha
MCTFGIEPVSIVSEKPGHPYAECDEFISYQIQTARHRIRWTDILTAGVLAGLLLVGYILVFTILDHWVIAGGFRPWPRAMMLVLVIGVCAAILVRFIVRPWFRAINPLYAARMLDRADSRLQGTLTALVDLKAAGRQPNEQIFRTMEKRAAVHLAEVHVDEAIDRRLLTRLGTVLFVLVVVTCIYAVASPKSISLLRPLTLAEASVATRTTIRSVRPGNVSVAAGAKVEVIADLSGVMPQEVFVLYSTEDQRFVDESLLMRSEGGETRFRAILAGEQDRGVRQSLQYRIVAGDSQSESYTLSVEPPPTAQVTQLTCKYPPYMGLPDRTEPSGNIDAWEGTELTILAESSVPVETARIEFSDTADFIRRAEEVRLTVRQTSLTATFKLPTREDGTFPEFYRIAVTDSQGRSDPEPTVYTVRGRKDQPPAVRLLDPVRDQEVPSNATVPLLIEAEDPDFMIRTVNLHYEINGTPAPRDEIIFDEFESGLQKKVIRTWDFSIQNMKLKPGDAVRFYISARDNKPPLGNRARTGDLQFTVIDPASQEAVDEQLRQDRRVQEQLQRDREADSPSGDSQAVREKAASPGNEPARTREENADPQQSPEPDTSETFPNNQKSADQNQPQKVSGEADKPGSGNRSEDRSSGESPAEPDENSVDSESPSQEQGSKDGSSAPDKPESDQEALQRILNSYADDKSRADRTDEPESNREKKSGGSEDKRDAADAHPEGGTSEKSGKTAAPESDRSEKDETQDKAGGDEAGGDEAGGDEAGGDEAGGDEAGGDEAGGDEAGGDEAGGDKAGGDKAGGDEAGGDKAGGDKAGGDKAGGDKAGGDKAGGDKAGGDKAGGDKAGGDKAGGDKAGGDKAGGDKAGGDKAGGDKAGGDKAGGDKAGGDKAGGDKAGGDKAGGDKAGGDKAGGDKAGGDKAGGDKAGGDKAGGDKAGGDKAGGDKAGGDKAGGDKAGGDKAGGDKAGGDKAGGDKAGGDKAGGDKAGGDKAGGDKAGGDKAGGDKAGGDKAGGDKAGGDKAGGDKAGGDKAGGDKAGGDKAGGDKAGGDKAGGDKAGGDKAGGDKAGGDKAGGDKAGGDKAGGDKAGGDKAGGDKAGGDKAGGDKAGGDKAGGDKAGGDKAGGDKAGGESGGSKANSEGSGEEGNGKSGSGGKSESPESDASKSGGTGGAEGQKDRGHLNRDGVGVGKDNMGGASGASAPIGDTRSEAGAQPEDGDRPGADKPEAVPDAPGRQDADDTARALDLSLRRLENDLKSGKMDPERLKELGWTESELKDFVARMQKQLKERSVTEQELKEQSLSRQSFEETLRSLSLKSADRNRAGRNDSDRQQQETTARQTKPPGRYSDRYRLYQKSISGSESGKSPGSAPRDTSGQK